MRPKVMKNQGSTLLKYSSSMQNTVDYQMVRVFEQGVPQVLMKFTVMPISQNSTEVHYDVSRLMTLSEYLQNIPGVDSLRSVLGQIRQMLEACTALHLPLKNVVLDANQVYYDSWSGSVRFIYLPFAGIMPDVRKVRAFFEGLPSIVRSSDLEIQALMGEYAAYFDQTPMFNPIEFAEFLGTLAPAAEAGFVMGDTSLKGIDSVTASTPDAYGATGGVPLSMMVPEVDMSDEDADGEPEVDSEIPELEQEIFGEAEEAVEAGEAGAPAPVLDPFATGELPAVRDPWVVEPGSQPVSSNQGHAEASADEPVLDDMSFDYGDEEAEESVDDEVAAVQEEPATEVTEEPAVEAEEGPKEVVLPVEQSAEALKEASETSWKEKREEAIEAAAQNIEAAAAAAAAAATAAFEAIAANHGIDPVRVSVEAASGCDEASVTPEEAVAASEVSEPVAAPEKTTALNAIAAAEVVAASDEGEPSPAGYWLTHKPTGDRFEIVGSRFVVGKSKYSDYQVRDTSTVSRSHAVFSVDEQGCWIEDDGSRNGVFLNNHRIEAHEKVLLEPGMVVRMSDQEFLFEEA